MTDWLPDSPVVLPNVCPTCMPNLDPREYQTRWCNDHEPTREGRDDERVDTSGYVSSGIEAGGEDNRRWCELIHRKRLLTGGAR